MFCEVEKKLNESKLENEKQRVITAEKEVTFEKEFQEEQRRMKNEKKEIEVILELERERFKALEAERINDKFQREQLEQRIADMQQEGTSKKNKNNATIQHKRYQDASYFDSSKFRYAR